MSRLLVRAVALVVASIVVACGKSPSAPTAPPAASNPPQPQPPASTSVVLNGQVTNVATGSPVGSIDVSLDQRTTTVSDTGTFRYELTPGSFNTRPTLRLTGPNIVERALLLALPGSRDVSVNVMVLGGGFDLEYYRRLVRDNFDAPGTLRSLRRWLQAPMLYVKTVDEAGTPIESSTLEPVISAFQDEASAWTGGRFGLAGIERGTGTREGENGWITVKWPAVLDGNTCGRAQVAANGGWIELYYQNRNCACRGSRISPGTARHELGHAMGFYHSGERDDVMWGTISCDGRPTARERLHATIAYGRPIGNTDPDTDPLSTPQSHLPSIVIVD